jgi:hypothetical protein
MHLMRDLLEARLWIRSARAVSSRGGSRTIARAALGLVEDRREALTSRDEALCLARVGGTTGLAALSERRLHRNLRLLEAGFAGLATDAGVRGATAL